MCDPIKLTLQQKIIIALSGRVFIEYRKHPDTHLQQPYYAVKCNQHGYYIDTPHGYYDRLDCPQCQQQRHELWNK